MDRRAEPRCGSVAHEEDVGEEVAFAADVRRRRRLLVEAGLAMGVAPPVLTLRDLRRLVEVDGRLRQLQGG